MRHFFLILLRFQFYRISPNRNLIYFLGHIQIAQVPDRHEPDSAGEINYDHIFDVIQSSGYDGWIGLEYKPKEGTENGLEWLKKYAN